MERSTPRIRSMLRQADKVAGAGKRSAATKLYRQIINEAPETTAAWVGLAAVLRDEDEIEEAYRKALALDPDNEDAQSGLAELLGEDTTSDDSPTQAEEIGKNGANEEELEKSEAAIKDFAEDLTDLSPSGSEDQSVSQSLAESKTAVLSDERQDQSSVDDPFVEHEHTATTTSTKEVLYCANHPNRKTHLRCNRCGKPICSSCAQPTPVGYRCPECIREHEDIFYTATILDYLVAVVVAVPLSLLGGWLATFLGFFTIFLGAFAGSLIGRVVFRAAGRRRGRWMPQMVGAIVVVGGILMALPAILGLLFGHFSLQIIWSGIYMVTAAGAAYYQMR